MARKLYKLLSSSKEHPENGTQLFPGDTFMCEETLIPAVWFGQVGSQTAVGNQPIVAGPLTPRGLTIVSDPYYPFIRTGTYDLDLGWSGEGTYDNGISATFPDKTMRTGGAQKVPLHQIRSGA